MEFDLSQLADIGAEKAILGGIFLENQMYYQCGALACEDFFVTSHRLIFAAMLMLMSQGNPVDLVTVSSHLGSLRELGNAGDVEYLSGLVDGVPDRPSIASYVKTVKDLSLRRRHVSLCNHAIEQAFDRSETTADCLNVTHDRILALSGQADGHHSSRLVDYSAGVYADVHRLASLPPYETIGLSTGIPRMDDMTTGIRPGELWIIGSWTGSGKCFAPGTKVLMADGSARCVEDVRVGDSVMGPDSLPRAVLSLSSGWGEMYKVTPVKGEPYVVNRQHILCLRTTEKKVYGKEFFELPVLEFLAKDQRFRDKAKGYRVGVEFPPQSIHVDPYYLGLWLGDGGTAKPYQIHNVEPEVQHFLSNYAKRWGLRLANHSPNAACNAWSLVGTKGKVNGLTAAMRMYGLGRKAKFIPSLFLRNGRQIRLPLLAGIIDTDGSYQNGVFDLIQKEKQLADDVLFLCRSLGLAAYCTPAYKKCQTGGGGIYYRISISGDLDQIPTLVKRKQARPRRQVKSVLTTGVSVKPVGPGRYIGFEVDGDHKFLLGDFTVTHNSAFLTQIIAANACKGVPVLWFTQEMTKRQVLLRIIPGVTEGKIRARDLRNPRNMTAAELRMFDDTQAVIDKWSLWVNDATALDVSHLVAHAHMMAKKHGIKLIAVDYLQLLRAEAQTRYERVTKISEALRELSKASGIPVVVVSQLSRPEEKKIRPPRPFDLKESGNVENDAHVILLPYRPQDKEGKYTGEDLIIVGKQREGPTGRVKVRFVTSTLTFDPREDGNDAPEDSMF